MSCNLQTWYKVLATSMLFLLGSCSDHKASPKRDDMTTISSKLARLEKEWIDQCKDHLSSSDMYIAMEQPAYKEIVNMGPVITPLVVERIRRNQEMSDRGISWKEDDRIILQWVWVLEEVTKHYLKDDSAYRTLVKKHYRGVGSESVSAVFDPEGVCYVPSIAVPYMLEWWSENERKQRLETK